MFELFFDWIIKIISLSEWLGLYKHFSPPYPPAPTVFLPPPPPLSAVCPVGTNSTKYKAGIILEFRYMYERKLHFPFFERTDWIQLNGAIPFVSGVDLDPSIK